MAALNDILEVRPSFSATPAAAAAAAAPASPAPAAAAQPAVGTPGRGSAAAAAEGSAHGGSTHGGSAHGGSVHGGSVHGGSVHGGTPPAAAAGSSQHSRYGSGGAAPGTPLGTPRALRPISGLLLLGARNWSNSSTGSQVTATAAAAAAAAVAAANAQRPAQQGAVTALLSDGGFSGGAVECRAASFSGVGDDGEDPLLQQATSSSSGGCGGVGSDQLPQPSLGAWLAAARGGPEALGVAPDVGACWWGGAQAPSAWAAAEAAARAGLERGLADAQPGGALLAPSTCRALEAAYGAHVAGAGLLLPTLGAQQRAV